MITTRSRHGPLTLCLAVAVLAGAAGNAADNRTAEGTAMPTCLHTGFEDGLAGWTQRGPAEFAADTGKKRAGTRSARITVPPGTELNYQQLLFDVRQDVQHGDAFAGSVWVRTEGVSGDPGAYFVLEFQGGGKRVGILHSTTGATNGALQWDRLEIPHAVAPPATDCLRVSLVLHAHGTAWFDDVQVVRKARTLPDLGDAVREVRVDTADVVHAHFGGVGFHVFHHVHPTDDRRMEIIRKRWRELNPSFARMNDSWEWDHETLDRVAAHMLRMKEETQTEIYLTTWGPKETQAGAEREAYAKRVVDNLEYLIREKGCTNIKTYCMTNELTLSQWGSLRSDLPTFKDYHQNLHDEIRARGLGVQLLATDAAPAAFWNTIEWATRNMDDITGIYGGHHYINSYAPDDPTFYPWFLEKATWAAGLARGKGKDFILGEFGCKQDGRTIDGKKRDLCIYWDTEQEPMVGIQLAEAVIAAVNAGVYAMGNWTFTDFPDDYRETYLNKWGLFKWSGDDTSTRDHYYGYGLLTRFLRGPATVYRVGANDPRLRVAALQHQGRRTFSMAVVNRNVRDVAAEFALAGVAGLRRFHKYVYDPADVPQHPFGDLQEPEAAVEVREGKVRDTLRAGTLTVYTSVPDDTRPAPVGGVTSWPGPDGRCRVTWDPNAEDDICYYRVYRGVRADFVPDTASQIGSITGTELIDRDTNPALRAFYKVVAVDRSGNAGPVE